MPRAKGAAAAATAAAVHGCGGSYGVSGKLWLLSTYLYTRQRHGNGSHTYGVAKIK
jgi:hypothetical protein